MLETTALKQAVPSKPWKLRFLKNLELQLPSLRPHELSMAIWALAQLGMKPGRVMIASICCTVLHLLPTFPPSELVMLLSALHKVLAVETEDQGHKDVKNFSARYKYGASLSRNSDASRWGLVAEAMELLHEASRRLLCYAGGFS